MVDRDVFRGLRQYFRGPIHQVISYAEILAEDSGITPDSQINCLLSRVIAECESVLRLVIVPPKIERQTADTLLDSVKTRLVGECNHIRLLTEEVVALIPAGSSPTVAQDVEKLERAVGILERNAINLTVAALTGATPVRAPAQVDGASLELPAAPGVGVQRGLVLIVDDDEDNRIILSRRLLADGCEVMLAESGRQALRILRRCPCDLVLLDIMLPEIDGIAVLREIKKSPELQDLPVIMMTADDNLETIVRCVKMGASDYLLKPFNSVLLRARARALLEGKRLRDAEKKREKELKTALAEVEQQRQATQHVLLNILPPMIAEELKNHGAIQPMYFEDVTIVFADIVGFTLSTERLPADELVQHLHKYFSAFDEIVRRYGLEKLKTIGDCYMFAGGLPVRCPSHPVDCVLAALEMLDAAKALGDETVSWDLRIGVHTGPVIAGVVGIHKFAFDIWGDTVNFASRLESCGTAGRINLSASTHSRVKDFFACEKRDKITIREGREVDTYVVGGVSASLLARPDGRIVEAFKARYQTYFSHDVPQFPSVLRLEMLSRVVA